MRKKILAALIILFICPAFLLTVRISHGSSNRIEFRLVLNNEDRETVEYSTVINGREALSVSKLYFLSDPDIEEVMMFRSVASPGKVMAGLRFNENGKNHLTAILQKFPNRRIAIFSGKAFIMILPPLSAGFSSEMMVIAWPRKEEELRWIAREINKKPESVIALYIDQMAEYHDVAAEEWAKVYDKAAKLLSSKLEETKTVSLEE